jgi:hypothetical protein
MCPSAKTPTIDLFLDESRVGTSQSINFITCAVAVESKRWDQITAQERDFRHYGKGSRLERILHILKKSNGFAVLTHAIIEKALLPNKRLDSTKDIAKMSRTDNVWSQCFLFCITSSLANLYKAGLRSHELRVFHDPKSLQNDHRSSIQDSIHSKITAIFQEAVQKCENTEVFLHINEIKEVPKPKRGDQPNRYQAGTDLADYLCGKFKDIVRTPRNSGIRQRVFVRDHTETVTKSLTENWPL